MADIYMARQRTLGRIVAIKMAHRHDRGREFFDRFVVEAKCLARMRHKNVLDIYDMGTCDGMPFLVLEYMSGGSLDSRLRSGPLPPKEAAALILTLAGGLQHVHAQGIVHRNLKPSNILVDADGTLKISSFTIAKLADESVPEAPGTVIGTLPYMAPEQLGGEDAAIGPPADIWALGGILYELLTGRPPFQADTALDTMLLVASEEPTAPRRLCPAVPVDLEKVCLKCLEKKIEDRYVSAEALANDLRLFLESRPIMTRPAGVLRRGWKWAQRHPAAIGIGIGLLLGLLLGVGLAGPLLSAFRG
jgi:serine/threonine protein kinase